MDKDDIIARIRLVAKEQGIDLNDPEQAMSAVIAAHAANFDCMFDAFCYIISEINRLEAKILKSPALNSDEGFFEINKNHALSIALGITKDEEEASWDWLVDGDWDSSTSPDKIKKSIEKKYSEILEYEISERGVDKTH